MAQRAAVATVLVVALFCSQAHAANHRLIWDRFWIATNTNSSRMLTVELGDSIILVCQVNITEQPQDVHENIVLLDNEDQLNNCNFPGNTVGNTANTLHRCVSNNFDLTIAVTDSLLSTQPSFVSGELYYLTSFSNGSMSSAVNDVVSGGGCASDPPLQLTVSVSAMVTESSSTVLPTSTTQVMSTTTITTTTIIRTTPVISPGGSMGGVGQLSPHLVLLVFVLVCSCLL